jgi:hypothetical protein
MLAPAIRYYAVQMLPTLLGANPCLILQDFPLSDYSFLPRFVPSNWGFCICKQGVTGSIPVTSTNFTSLHSSTYAAICNDSLVESFGAFGATVTGMVNP